MAFQIGDKNDIRQSTFVRFDNSDRKQVLLGRPKVVSGALLYPCGCGGIKGQPILLPNIHVRSELLVQSTGGG